MRRRDMSGNDIPILEEERRHRPPTCLWVTLIAI
jgi:hypothetical protein